MSEGKSGSSRLQQTLGLVAIELVFVAAAWWFLKLDNLLAGAIAGAVLVSTLAPPRIGALVSGVCFLGLAALTYFHYRQDRVAMFLGLIGVVYLVIGIARVAVRRK